MPQNLPTTWLGLLALVVALIVPPTVAVWQSRRTRARVATVQTSVDGITEQTTNKHTSNLRDDLTETKDQVSEMTRILLLLREHVEKNLPGSNDLLDLHKAITGIADDVRYLRGEIGTERRTRHDEIAEEGVAREKLEKLIRSYHPEPPGE